MRLLKIRFASCCGIRLFLLISTVMISAPVRSSADIIRRPFWTDPDPVLTLNEIIVADLCDSAWGTEYNIFDYPGAMCMLAAGEQTNVEHFFVTDKTRNEIRYFGTIEDAYGNRELSYFKLYAPGKGSGDGQFNRPESITISPRGPGYTRYLYVLDAGNNRIHKIEVDTYVKTLTWLGYVYEGDVPGYGLLNRARDIDYCELHDDDNPDNDFLLVADTFNHRIIGLKPDGSVLWSVGVGEPGSGAGQFSYPTAVTAVRGNPTDNSALIYVADKGNNRIVKLQQDDLWNVQWVKTMDMPTDGNHELSAPGRRPAAGLEDIEVDADGVLSGVYVLDSAAPRIFEVDYPLNSILQTFDTFDVGQYCLYGLELSRGELGLVEPYTSKTGMKLFEVRASIYNLDVSPSPFKPPLEWAVTSMTVTGAGTLDVWVETLAGEHVATLLDDWFAMPGMEYAIWDGKDEGGQTQLPDNYRIKARLKDRYWQDYTETKEIQVEVEDDSSFVIVTEPYDFARQPDWSSDGSKLTYSAQINDTTFIVSWELDTENEEVLTPNSDGINQAHPSWSLDGEKIAWTKEVMSQGMRRSLIHMMDADGSNKEMLSDTTLVPEGYWFWEHNPQWVPSGGEVSYLRWGGTGIDTLKKHELSTGSKSTIITSGGPENRDYAWSPNGDEVAFVGSADGIQMDEIYVYDLDGSFFTRLTEDPDSERVFLGMDWSPDGQNLLVTDWSFWASRGVMEFPEFRSNVMVMPATGGVAVPVSGFTGMNIQLGEGVSWSPDGTKLVLPVTGIGCTDLVAADFIRGSRAFPAAYILHPFAQQAVGAVVAIVGTVDDNIGVQGGDPLSELQDYYVQWGQGPNPETWSDYGIKLRDCCPVVNDTLATWNTGVVESGTYSLRLVASDGADSNIVCRRVIVSHTSYTVAADGSGDFTSLQAAIDAAQVGDTIKIFAGEYDEQITVKQTVTLVAAEDSVVINGGNGTAMTIVNHDYPCRIEGITIRNSLPGSQTRGILINNASPVVRNCDVIGHNNPGVDGAGVYIAGDSHPEFFDCEIKGNTGQDGAGVYVHGMNTDKPAPSFVSCRIVDNSATNYGGGIACWYAEPLDSTYQQPQFANCVIDSNKARKGSAVYLTRCHAPVFSGCSISTNRINETTNSLGIIDGYESGIRVYNCTLTGNDGLGSNQCVISLLAFSGVSKPVRAERCIIAFNGLEAIDQDSACLMNYSDLFGNLRNDDDWLTQGEGNTNENPAICDKEAGDYNLYAFSPCAPNVSTVGLVGAYNVSCVPPCNAYIIPDSVCWPPEVATTCPGGDGDALIVALDFQDSVMTRDLDTLDMWLGPIYDNVTFFSEGLIYAESSADSSGSFMTTITHKHISGCCSTTVKALLDGIAIDQQPSVIFRSPDLDQNGKVGLPDLAIFCYAFPSCEGDSIYNECADFITNSCVNLNDLAFYAFHEFCKYEPPGSPPAVAAGQTTQSSVEVQLSFLESRENVEQHKLYVTMTLEALEPFSVMSLSLDIGNGALEYVGWTPNSDFPARSYGLPIHRDGREMFFVAGFDRKKTAGAPSPVLGTVEFNIKDNVELSLGESDFQVVRGGILHIDGTEREFGGAQSAGIESYEVTYGDYLAQNHPNPFNPSTTIEYSISEDSHVNISIYNVKGQLVRTLVDEPRTTHNYRVIWDGTSDEGNPVASGAYFCRLRTDKFTQTKKLILLR